MSDKVYTYTITNNILETVVYVGRSKSPKNRWYQHKIRTGYVYMNKVNNKWTCKNIHKHMAEYGIENFTFTIVCDYNCEAQLQEELKPIYNMKYEKI